jgi:hypothetical protein
MHCATHRQVPELILGGVTGKFFRESNNFMYPASTQPLKLGYQNTPGGKDGRCVWLTTYQIQVPVSRNLGTVTSQTLWDP